MYLNGYSSPYVQVKYLGHNSVYINNIFKLDTLISEIKTRTNIILSYFKFLTNDSEIKFLNTNCSSFYGGVLCNQVNNLLKKIYRAWIVCCRKILSLPSRTYCDLIPN